MSGGCVWLWLLSNGGVRFTSWTCSKRSARWNGLHRTFPDIERILQMRKNNLQTEANGFSLSSAVDLLELSGRVVWLSFNLTFVCFSNGKIRQTTGACTLRFRQSFGCYRFYIFSRVDTREPSTAVGWQKELRFVADFFYPFDVRQRYPTRAVAFWFFALTNFYYSFRTAT